MRAVFGVVGLLVALAIVGIIVKKQLQATRQSVSAVAPSASAANVAEQSRQIQQQGEGSVVDAVLGAVEKRWASWC